MNNFLSTPFTKLFLMASAWNFLGALFGFFNTELAYEYLFNKEVTDPIVLAIYKGAWGTTLTYFIGYILVALDPPRHFAIAITGGLGKLGFIATLGKLYFAGLADALVLVIILGDSIFVVLFLYFFYKIANQNSKIHNLPSPS